MGKYTLRRVLLLFPTLAILSVIIFTMMRILPGDVAYNILSGGGGGVAVTEESLNALRKQLGLTDPLPIQYVKWLWDTTRGDLGVSLLSGNHVSTEILRRMPLTFQIAFFAQILSITIGIPVGIMSAVKQNSPLDLSLRFFSILFLAVPVFWVALMVILAGGLVFNWTPPIGYNPIWIDAKRNLLQMMWPSLILSLGGFAVQARMVRSTMLEVLREDYIRTARAKGLREQVVILRHALKNALIPNVTIAGLNFAALMGGTVILEQIFAIPGMGQMFLVAINTQDYPVVQGIVMVFAIIFMLVNLIIDLIYGWLDPRISYS